MALGSDDPIIKGVILSMFAVSGFGILLNIFNAAVRKKMVDQVKLKRIMKETTWMAKRKNGCNEIKRSSKDCRTRKKIIIHEQNVNGDDADEYETYDDYICSFNFDILSSIAATIFIHCSFLSNLSKCNPWRYVPVNLYCRTST